MVPDLPWVAPLAVVLPVGPLVPEEGGVAVLVWGAGAAGGGAEAWISLFSMSLNDVPEPDWAWLDSAWAAVFNIESSCDTLATMIFT